MTVNVLAKTMYLNIFVILFFFCPMALNIGMVRSILLTAFERNQMLDNNTCVGSSRVFQVVGKFKDQVHCLFLCRNDTRCFGVFYDKIENVCTGCTDAIDWQLDATGLQPAHLTQFYFRKSRYHREPCLNMTTCDSLQYCGQVGVCFCLPGYSYNPTSDTCVESCNVYSQKYETHLGFSIINHGQPVATNTSVPECKAICSADPNCRTFDHVRETYNLGSCWIRQVTALTHPGDFITCTGCVHRHRNCAKQP